MPHISRFGGYVLLAVACLTIMVGCVIVPGLTSISRALGAEGLASWLVTVPSLGVVLFGPIMARLLGKTGLRNGLRIGLLAYGALGVAGIFLHSPWVLLADRLLLGGATALIMASGTGLISLFYSGHQRLSMIARQGMSIELGGVIFLFVGGLLATAGWQYPFLLYLLAWVLLVGVEFSVPSPLATDDMRSSQTTPRISAALWTVYTAAAISMIVFFSAIISLPKQLHSIGLNEAGVGYFLSFVSLVAVGAAAVMPHSSARYGEVATLVRAFIFYGIAHLLFLLSDTLELYVLAGVSLGCGFGLSIPLVNHMTIELTHERERGHMLAYLSMAIFLGQFLSSLLELAPGGGKALYGVAAFLAVITAVSLAVRHCQHRRA